MPELEYQLAQFRHIERDHPLSQTIITLGRICSQEGDGKGPSRTIDCWDHETLDSYEVEVDLPINTAEKKDASIRVLKFGLPKHWWEDSHHIVFDLWLFSSSNAALRFDPSELDLKNMNSLKTDSDGYAHAEGPINELDPVVSAALVESLEIALKAFESARHI